MRISFHGGECCGIKHIHGLGYRPSAHMAALAEQYEDPIKWPNDKTVNRDQYGLAVSSDYNCFYHAAPAETALERLDRYLEFIDGWRPFGITEIVLCNYATCCDPEDYDQVAAWEALLLERGFVLTSSCYNSNSKNRIYIYHRVKDKE